MERVSRRVRQEIGGRTASRHSYRWPETSSNNEHLYNQLVLILSSAEVGALIAGLCSEDGDQPGALERLLSDLE